MLVEPCFFYQFSPIKSFLGHKRIPHQCNRYKRTFFFFALQNKHVTKLAHLQKSQWFFLLFNRMFFFHKAWQKKIIWLSYPNENKTTSCTQLIVFFASKRKKIFFDCYNTSQKNWLLWFCWIKNVIQLLLFTLF